MLIIDIYTFLHDTFTQNDDDVCLQPGCFTLMVSICSALIVDIFFFLLLSFFLIQLNRPSFWIMPPSPFYFVTREITSEAQRNFPLCDSVINKHTVNKINNKQDAGLKITL